MITGWNRIFAGVVTPFPMGVSQIFLPYANPIGGGTAFPLTPTLSHPSTLLRTGKGRGGFEMSSGVSTYHHAPDCALAREIFAPPQLPVRHAFFTASAVPPPPADTGGTGAAPPPASSGGGGKDPERIIEGFPWERPGIKLNRDYHALHRDVQRIIQMAYLKFLELRRRAPEKRRELFLNGAVSLISNTPEIRQLMNVHHFTVGELHHFLLLAAIEAERQVRTQQGDAGSHQHYQHQAELIGQAIEAGRTSRTTLMAATGYGESMIDQIVGGNVVVPRSAVAAVARCIGIGPDKLEKAVSPYRRRLVPEAKVRLQRQIGRAFREAREALGKSQRSIEYEAHIPRGRLCRIERGREPVYRDRFDTLVQTLRIPPDRARQLERLVRRLSGTQMMPRPFAASGNLITSARMAALLNIGEAVERLGLSVNRYSNVEGGFKPLPERLIDRFAQMTDIDPVTLRATIGRQREKPFASEVQHPFTEAGRLIDNAIRRRGLSRMQTARLLKTRGSDVSSLRSGTRMPSAEGVAFIEERLGIDRGRLMGAYRGVLTNQPHAVTGQRIREARRAKGMWSKTLAREIGTTSQILSLIEAGNIAPTPGQLEKLKTILSIEI